jgi:iron complex outermembrane receptor protein
MSLQTVARAILLAIFSFGSWMVAGAQDSSSTASMTNAQNELIELPAVTVVAQKEPQSAQTLPVSVTAVTARILEDANIHTLKEASIYAPATFINEFTARAVSNPFFRGIGGSPLNPGVTTFIDGVPQLNSYSANIEFVDVDQVEFVRGPQGALFGRNTAAGVINVMSRPPSDIWSGGVEGSYGNYDYRDVRANVSGPIVKDTIGLSLAGGYSARDGYTKNDFTGNDLDHREAGFGKGQLLFRLNERLQIRVIGFGEHDNDGDYALGDLAAIRSRPHHVSRDFEGFNRRDVASGTMLVDYFGRAIDVTSISAGVWWKNEGLTDLDYTAFPGNTRDNVEEQHQLSQEFRLASSKDKPLKLSESLDLAWQSGVFAFSQSYDQHILNSVVFPNPVPPPDFFPVDNKTTADLDDWGVGVYGQARLTAWEKLDFTAGLRYDYEDKQGDLTSVTIPPLAPSSSSSLSDNFSQVSPQFALAYHFTPSQMAYGSAARGFRAGGFNQTSPPGSERYGTEHSWNYEVGFKSLWFDNRVETTIALFYIDWRNLQLNEPVPGSGGTSFFIDNAGAAVSKGVELETKWRPMPGWDLFGSAGYTDAKFLSDSVSLGANVGGHRLPFAPMYTGNVGTQFSWSPCKAATLYARAEVAIYGDFEYDPSNAQSQSTYALADFRAGIRGTHWFAEGWVKNAFDANYVPIAIPFSSASGYVGESGAPVTFGGRVGIQF